MDSRGQGSGRALGFRIICSRSESPRDFWARSTHLLPMIDLMIRDAGVGADDHANAHDDDEEARAAVAQRASAVEALQKAWRAHARRHVWTRVPQGRPSRVEGSPDSRGDECDTLSAKLRDAADRRRGAAPEAVAPLC